MHAETESGSNRFTMLSITGCVVSAITLSAMQQPSIAGLRVRTAEYCELCRVATLQLDTFSPPSALPADSALATIPLLSDMCV